MGGYRYHYQISSYVLTHGSVVISRLDDRTKASPPPHTYTHTHSPTVHICIYTHMHRDTILLLLVNVCALAPACQRPCSL